MFLFMTVCVVLCLVPTLQVSQEEAVSVSEATAVLTGVARLPCDLNPSAPGDKVALVIWYKDGAKSPIYSLDVRGRSLDQATHWADERTLGGRAFFRVGDEPEVGSAHLAVESVREVDGGSYRCRVDFKNSPTRNAIVNLTIIVPPKKLTIQDETGSNIQRRVVGPYTEGTTAQITCIASGGRPAPRVSWWKDGLLVDDSDEALSERRIKNVLRVERLERRHLNTVYTCQATNNNVLTPVAANVTLDMYLKPLDVHLLGENQPLSAANEYEVACQSTGSRPAASITWWKTGILLDHTRETTSPDGNVTTSTLTLAPQVDDSGKSLTCRANNPHISGSALEDTWDLSVHYSPLVSLELGSNLNGSSIREGVDVYFECNIQANPWIYKVIWRHNGNSLHNNASTGIILSNQTLVLQSVTRNISGQYTCVASNTEGDSESNIFNLDVKYEPVCTAGQQRVYGAARLEEVKVNCDVDANPPATLFRWLFNNSAVQSLEVGSTSSDPGGGRSVASYTPTSERDYGTLLCWGRNELGAQLHPCVFHIVPAGKPDAPHHCVLTNRTSISLQVKCSRGFDGGLPQEFTMEVFSSAESPQSRDRLVSNVTSRSKPEFAVSGLEPGVPYVIRVYSSNGKGRSGQTETLKVTTLKTTQQEHRRTTTTTSAFPSFPHVTPVLWILAGIIVTLGVAGIAAVVVLRFRGRLCLEQDDDDRQTSTSSPEVVDPAKMAAAGHLLTVALPGGKVAPHHLGGSDDTVEMDDRNPDLIPHTNDMDYPSSDYNVMYDKMPILLGAGESSFSIDTVNKDMYGNVHSFPRMPSADALRFEAPPVRWQHQPLTTWRDTGTQSQPLPQLLQPLQPLQPTNIPPHHFLPTPSQAAPLLHPHPATAAQKMNAETQTPLLVRHKESAV